MQRRAFTLIELLVVVAIVGVLLFFIQAALFSGRPSEHNHDMVRQAKCQAGLHVVGIAIQSYMNANNNIMPPGAWMPLLATDESPPFGQVMADYIDDSDLLKCPSDYESKIFESKGSSYEYNWTLGGKVLDLSQPGVSNLPVMFDHEPFHASADKRVPVNCLRADGSVEVLSEVPDLDMQLKGASGR